MTARFDALPSGFSEHAHELEVALKSLVSERPLPLYRMMGYHMGWVETTGEPRVGATPTRIHGALALMACKALGGHPADALAHASAVEYLYNHILIHDDIRDGNAERDGRPSVWWSWGPAQAINTGDGMHALARLALFEARKSGASVDGVADAIRILDEANLETCEGQYRDIALQERLDVGVDEYLSMAESQTGALLSAAGKLGAVASGEAEDREVEALGRFGRKLGAAMRIADDCDVFWPAAERDETRQGRLVAKKKTLPVAYVIETGSPTERRRVGEIYMERVIDPSAAKTLTEILDSAGSQKYAQDTIERLLSEALEALEEASEDSSSSDLAEAARFLATPAGLAGSDAEAGGVA